MRAEGVVRLAHGSHVIEVVNDSSYSLGSRDNQARYQREEILGDAQFQLTSRHGLISMLAGAPIASVTFGATGGASGVHERSLALLEDVGFLAVGPFIACVDLPMLGTRWVRQVDSATCFGIHICADGSSLISHGELEIARLTLGGDILWRAAGRDIFTGDISVEAAGVHAEDFNGATYWFELETGDELEKRRPIGRGS